MFAMRIPLALACALAVQSAVLARPVILEESAIVANPSPATYPIFAGEVAVGGDYALISGYRDDNDTVHYAAMLYRRVSGVWTFDRILDRFDKAYDSYTYPLNYALKGTVAVIANATQAKLYQRTGSTWTLVPGGHGFVEDVETDGQRVLTGTGGSDTSFYWDGEVFERDSTGAWQGTLLRGQPRGYDDEFWGGPIDLDGDRAILGTPYTYDGEPQEIPIYQRAGFLNWPLLGKLQVPAGAGRLGEHVALRGDDAIVDADGGAYVWRLPDLSAPVDRLQAIDSTSIDPNNFTPVLEKGPTLVCLSGYSPDRQVRVINVFRPESTGKYRHIAVLVAKNGVNLRSSYDISGTTIIAGGSDNRAHVFQLPSTFTVPAARSENFEAGAANWTPQAGAQFTVATSGTNHVYRQSSVAGDARALFTGANWRDQAIEADVRPTAFSGTDRWVGLITRYQDASNFIYVTLRSSGSVQLRRMRGGTVTELARAPLTVTLNRLYRVRLESVGSTHRVYVDGQLLLDVDDTTAAQTGSAGLAMYRARADYDNVVVSPSPHTSIFANDFPNDYYARAGSWKHTGTGQWQLQSGVYAQSSTAGDARALIGTPTNDQIVQASVRPIAYAAAGGTSERWSGLIARYTNDSNYYYLSMRSGNTIGLRKRQSGQTTVLASAPMTVSLNTPHTLRLEVVGNQLRGYVDGKFVLQATDSSLPSGSVGLVTYRAATNFDNFDAYQP